MSSSKRSGGCVTAASAVLWLCAAGCSAEAPAPSSSAGTGGGSGAAAGVGGGGSGGNGGNGGNGGSSGGGATNSGGTGALSGSGGAGATGGVAGSAATGGNAGVAAGGSSATGGSAGVAGGSGGAAGNGGSGGNAGVGGAGGSAGVGGGAGIGGGAGVGGGGSGGSGGSGGTPAEPSAGCSKAAGRPAGGLVTVTDSHIYWFPESYDGTTPMPLIMALHAAGNQNTQLRNITQNSALAQHFVMAFPKSQGNGWNFSTDRQRIDQHYNRLLADYCIDTSRVFATGHSSGAQMIVQLMCAGEDRFKAIAPVASSAYCSSWDNPVPSLIIHGEDDRERANTNQDADGRKDLAPYLASAGCQMTSVPHAQAGCSRGSMQVDPGCVEFQGCSERTIWCQHNDPEYGVSNHGWPCFANDAMDAFFRGLP